MGSVAGQLGAVKSACLLYGLQLAIILVFLIISMFAKDHLSAEVDFVEQALLAVITLFWVGLYWADVRGAIFRRVHPLWFLASVLISGATFGIASGVVRILGLLGIPSLEYSTPFREGEFGFGAFVLSLAVLPAVFEELAFRGVMLPAMWRVLGPWEGVFVVSMMFGILHLSVPSLPHLVLLGLALGTLRLKTGSILPGILVHFCHNFWVGLTDWRF